MTTFKVQTKLKCELFRYTFLGYWNNQFGPQPRIVWPGTESSIDTDEFKKEVKTVTEVVLKSQVGRELENSLIDRNIFELNDQGACVVSYVFSIRSTAGPGSLCTLNFVLKSGHSGRFLKYSSVLDTVTIHHLRAYRVILYKDFDRGTPDCSNEYIEHLMNVIDKTTVTLFGQVCGKPISVESTYFYNEKKYTVKKKQQISKQQIKYLKEVIQSVLSSFNRIVILGEESHRSEILRWCRTCTLLVPEHERDLCITDSPVNQLLPNMLVQCCVIKSKSDAVKISYSYLVQSDYPCAILDLRTSPYKIWSVDLQHYLSCKLDYEKSRALYYLNENLASSTFSSDKENEQVMNKFREAKDVNHAIGRLVDDFVDQISDPGMTLHENFLTDFTSSLYRRAATVIEYIQVKQEKSSSDRKGNLDKHILCTELHMSEEDLMVIISIAETFQPGVYSKIGLNYRAELSLAQDLSDNLGL